MKVSLSTHVCLQQPLSELIIQQIKSAGFENLELWGMRPHFDCSKAEAFGRFIQQQGIKVAAIHAPFYTHVERFRAGERLSLASVNQTARETAINETHRIIKTMPTFNCSLLVVHPGDLYDQDNEELKTNLKNSLLTLLNFCTPLEIRIALENTPSPLGSPENVCNMVKEIGHSNLGLCLDLGHANLKGDLSDLIPKFAFKLFHIHASDNDKCKDQHLVPGEGTINWLEVKKALQEIEFAGFLSWEIRYLEIWPDVLTKIHEKSGNIFPLSDK